MADERQKIYIRPRAGVNIHIHEDGTLDLDKKDILWRLYQESGVWILEDADGHLKAFWDYDEARKYAEETIHG